MMRMAATIFHSAAMTTILSDNRATGFTVYDRAQDVSAPAPFTAYF